METSRLGPLEKGKPVPRSLPMRLLQAEYNMDTSSFWSTTKIFFGAACVVVAIIWFIRMRNWQLRSTRLVAVVTQYSQSIASINWKALVRSLPPSMPHQLETPISCPYLLASLGTHTLARRLRLDLWAVGRL